MQKRKPLNMKPHKQPGKSSTVGLFILYSLIFIALMGFVFIGSYMAGQMATDPEKLQELMEQQQDIKIERYKSQSITLVPEDVTIQAGDYAHEVVVESDHKQTYFDEQGRPTISYEETIHPEDDVMQTSAIKYSNASLNQSVLQDKSTTLADRLAARGINNVEDLLPKVDSGTDLSGINVDEEVGKGKLYPKLKTSEHPSWLQYSQAIQATDKDKNAPFIAIVIDDVGVDYKRSLDVINIDDRLTLSFLPYANNVEKLSNAAHQLGHEVMVHVPMEPQDLVHNNPGPNALLKTNTASENVRRLRINLNRIPTAIGANNHMGSALTEDDKAMMLVMSELKNHGMLFLDSRTSAKSVAQKIAEMGHMPNATRDVFLDHDPSFQAVMGQLNETLRIAQKKGYAVAIGHPKDNTILALKQWLPTIKGLGVKVVPLTAIVKRNLGDNVALYDVGYGKTLPTPENRPQTMAEKLNLTEPKAGEENMEDDEFSGIAEQLKQLDTHPNIIVDKVSE